MLTTFLLALLVSPAHATSTGKTGVSTTGCGSCHGSSASSATTVTFATATGSTTVEPGDTITVYLSVSNSAQSAAGLDVSASGGTLAAGTNTKLSSSEITHSSATTMTSGTTKFEFEWTAPTTEGTYTLSGAGNAVNANRASSGDAWNTSTMKLTVDDGCLDLDADLYTDCDGDCNDGDAAINPGASETCDGFDQNCDGLIDNDAVDQDAYYPDNDGDTFGATVSATFSCEYIKGMVLNNDDCDDAEITVNPDATEIWYDGIDQDCDKNDKDQDGDGKNLDKDCDDTDPLKSAPEDCEEPDTDVVDTDPEDTEETDVEDTDEVLEDDKKCASAPGAGLFGALGALALVGRRRRR